MRRPWLVGAVVLATVAPASAVLPADGSGLQTAAERPPGAVTQVEIEFGGGVEGGGWGRVSWTVFYPARSATEAAQAENGSLSVEWFRGREHVRTAVDTYLGSNVTNGGTDVTHVPSDDGSDFGRVVVNYRTTWEGVFAGNRSRVVVGPAFAARLSEGDWFTIFVPKSWEAESANANRYSAGSELLDHYGWTIGEDPTPRLVLNESVLGPDRPWSDGVPGPGPALALLALLVAVGARRWLERA